MTALASIGHDLRYAVRSLLRDRGSVALAVAALSLGIGATTLIFSVVYSVLVNSFPFRDQSRVVHFYPHTAGQDNGSWWYTTREFLDYKAQFGHPFLFRSPLDLPAGTIIRGVPEGASIFLLPAAAEEPASLTPEPIQK